MGVSDAMPNLHVLHPPGHAPSLWASVRASTDALRAAASRKPANFLGKLEPATRLERVTC